MKLEIMVLSFIGQHEGAPEASGSLLPVTNSLYDMSSEWRHKLGKWKV